MERSDKVIAKINWCSFLPHSVHTGGLYVDLAFRWLEGGHGPCHGIGACSVERTLFKVFVVNLNLYNNIQNPESSVFTDALSEESSITCSITFFTCYRPVVKFREGMGEISESIFRRVIYASKACFRFRICCFYSKPERFKGN